MAKVPDTTTFSLQNVVDVVNPTTDDLSDCFSDGNSSYYDATYSGSKNSLYNFRNYGLDGTTTTTTVSPCSYTLYNFYYKYDTSCGTYGTFYSESDVWQACEEYHDGSCSESSALYDQFRIESIDVNSIVYHPTGCYQVAGSSWRMVIISGDAYVAYIDAGELTTFYLYLI